MEIVMARGDLEIRKFKIATKDESGQCVPFIDNLDNIYFTVKTNSNQQNYIFQKRLSDFGIVPLGNGEYQFTIEPEDTDNMMYGNYAFDIELVKEGEIKKTFYGTFVLTKEVTFASNEVRV